MSDRISCFWIERFCEHGYATWTRTDTGAKADTMDGFGPGALFAEPESPEDIHVKTPDGWANLRTWARTGDPKRPGTFSASPSIQTHGKNPWHGHLTNGVLEEC